VKHPSGIPDRIVEKVMARRGRLHAFETIVPERTALVVIDLVTSSMEDDETRLRLTSAINALVEALRSRGGAVAWVTSRQDRASANFANLRAIVGDATAERFAAECNPATTSLWPDLDVDDADLHAQKTGASAFFPGKCDLHPWLQARGIDTLLIAGLVTNVCCESSARDATELGYRVILVSDALAGHAFGLHEATLATFYRIFGDVRPSDEVAALIRRAPLTAGS